MKTLLFIFLCCCTAAFGQVNGLRAPIALKPQVPTASEKGPGLVFRSELVKSMKKLLWTEANEGSKDGPVDGIYFSLAQENIEDLFSFVRARCETFPYIPEAWDCDDFALEFHYLARVWAVRATQGAATVTPAVGIAYVKLDGPYPLFRNDPYISNVYHAINVVLRNDGQWFFIEPQNGNIMPIEGSIYEGAIEVVKIAL